MSEIIPEDYFYLASPYSHPDEAVRKQREIAVSHVAALLTKKGLNLFCPITQSHRLNDFLDKDNQLGHDECMRVDYALLDKATTLIVVALEGWKESIGVKLEIDYAKQHNKYVYILEPNTVNDWSNEVARILYHVTFQKNQLDKETEMSYDKDEVHKGASKAGKPSILNFPWAGISTLGPSVFMDSIIQAALDKNHQKLLQELRYLQHEILEELGITYMDVNKVFVEGLKKHGLRSHRNYTEEDIVPVLIEALGRHILKGISEIDLEYGLPHGAHAIANILMIRQVLTLKEKNDGE